MLYLIAIEPGGDGHAFGVVVADIPVAGTVARHQAKPEFAGRIWAVVDVDVTRYMGKAAKINITLPASLIRRIDDFIARHREYRSRSGFRAQSALDRITHSSASAPVCRLSSAADRSRPNSGLGFETMAQFGEVFTPKRCELIIGTGSAQAYDDAHTSETAPRAQGTTITDRQ